VTRRVHLSPFGLASRPSHRPQVTDSARRTHLGSLQLIACPVFRSRPPCKVSTRNRFGNFGRVSGTIGGGRFHHRDLERSQPGRAHDRSMRPISTTLLLLKTSDVWVLLGGASPDRPPLRSSRKWLDPNGRARVASLQFIARRVVKIRRPRPTTRGPRSLWVSVPPSANEEDELLDQKKWLSDAGDLRDDGKLACADRQGRCQVGRHAADDHRLSP
jgi:hypothetical protein